MINGTMMQDKINAQSVKLPMRRRAKSLIRVNMSIMDGIFMAEQYHEFLPRESSPLEKTFDHSIS